jgi:NAD(P)-dependent dehydrogenase (short-subunit alcohol dehydrogenase family)
MTPRTVLITGGAGGMGRACARRFAAAGDRVVAADLAPAALDKLRAELAAEGLAIETCPCDVSDAAAVSALFAHLAASGPVGAIVHTAGLSGTMGTWQRVMQVNLVGTARILEAALPHVGPGSAAVCIASLASYASPPVAEVSEVMREPLAPDLLERLASIPGIAWDPNTAYSHSKIGVRQLVARSAAAWGQRGARVVSISPGIIDTPMSTAEYAANPMMREMSRLTPLGRDGRADEIASAAEFLCSPAASYISGSDVLVDGGVAAALGLIPGR